ncbi:MAG: Rne/Rng family ribonuclease [Bacteroidales bacterium]|nr:Rne/Rng family ribonuclease [Bacteroidales bacterium]MBN2755976.1 Rne/Rng family ribonuclease [Bacteroidales bacterium]
MSNELVIDVRESEIQIALLEDKKLVELTKEKSNKRFSVGDIFLGKVKKIMTGLNAAFVDVGSERDAFLHYLDLGPQFMSQQKYLKQVSQNENKRISLQNFKLEDDINKNGKISDLLETGKKILVQVAKEPISTKGPRITSEITIAGRNLVLIPFSDKVSISQKIKSIEEKERLKRLIQSIKPKNYGVIVRTVAKNRRVAVLHAELNELVDKWENMFIELEHVEPPELIMSELNRTSALLRDLLNNSFNSIVVNDNNLLREIREYVESISPEQKKIVKKYTGRTPIFEHFGIEKQSKSLFGKTVTIKNGAYLIIEHTEALHVIDVNSGNRSKKSNDQETNALEVNIASAEEIARQLRLRDMGGIIVVDFIDMHSAQNKQLVFDKMKDAMASDRTKHNILPLSKFGLMQITRQRVRPEMAIETLEVCPTCNGTGEITASIVFVDEIYNNLKYLSKSSNLNKIIIKLHPYIAAYILKGLISKRLKWALKLKLWIKIVPVSSMSLLEYKFYNSKEDRIFV